LLKISCSIRPFSFFK